MSNNLYFFHWVSFSSHGLFSILIWFFNKTFVTVKSNSNFCQCDLKMIIIKWVPPAWPGTSHPVATDCSKLAGNCSCATVTPSTWHNATCCKDLQWDTSYYIIMSYDLITQYCWYTVSAGYDFFQPTTKLGNGKPWSIIMRFLHLFIRLWGKYNDCIHEFVHWQYQG